MIATVASTKLSLDPPGPGPWEQDPVHFPRPVTRYFQETHPIPFKRGTNDFARFYGMLIDGLQMSYVKGFGYHQMLPVPEAEIPQRFQRAELRDVREPPDCLLLLEGKFARRLQIWDLCTLACSLDVARSFPFEVWLYRALPTSARSRTVPNDLAISRTCVIVGRRGVWPFPWSLNLRTPLSIAASVMKSRATEQTTSHCARGALCGVFGVAARRSRSSSSVACINIDCCTGDTAESRCREHLDFAKVCCLMSANHRIRAPLARTLTPIGQPCDVGSTVPLPVCVGISRYRA